MKAISKERSVKRGERRRRAEGGGRSKSPNLQISKFPNSQFPAPRPSSPAPRAGVLLLVVLAVLALFGLIAVAFVILSGQARRSAKSIERFEQVTDPPEKLLHQAAMQVFRGPTTDTLGVPDPASAMQAHSLLEDIYGNDPAGGTISSAAFAALPQLVNLTVAGIPTTELSRRIGCVLTIYAPTTSPCYGLSTRIVAITSGSTDIQVVAFPNISDPTVLNGNSFTINGVPFSGTGFGYDSKNHNLDLTLDSTTGQLSSNGVSTINWPVALLPNLPLSIYADPIANPLPLPIYAFGGTNEDYDAADFQNMILAAQEVVHNPNGSINFVYTIPSLHRPALVRYWINKLLGPTGTWSDLWNANPELCRKIMLRPIGAEVTGGDHPNFTGSNPNFNPGWFWEGSYGTGPGQWDVDNDGDGTPDSVWVDLGMPVRATADGRLYKPLFAILCVDLDGRLNLNAHGSLAQVEPNYANPATPAGTALAGGVSASALPRGQGLGPAEVNLNALLPSACCQSLLAGVTVGSTNYPGRYGYPGFLSPCFPDGNTLSANKWFEYGSQNYWNFAQANNAGSYGSPPDPFGVGAVGLDMAGRPLYVGFVGANYYLSTKYLGAGSDAAGIPYELNLDANVSRGIPGMSPNPFSPSELERILRPFDRDAPRLPDRLAQLTAATPGDTRTSVLYNVRHSLTGESWDLPCPNVVTPWDSTDARWTALGGRVKHITDLLRARGVPETAWAELLPPDLLAGLRMNINRPFGNGLDDDGNRVVDEPSETNTIYGEAFSYDGTDGTTSGVTTPLAARQLEARYLYVLACLTVDLSSLNGPTRFGSYEETARFLAQWAVNAVDFKDRDSIMTPFDYDPEFANPSATPAGWNVTVGTSPRVWGCERPELLISEMLAFHDRRTEDAASEEVDNTEGDNQVVPATTTAVLPTIKDGSFDQRYKPQGSLFIELYNPWSIMEPRSGDLYKAPNGGVDLAKVSATGDSPVWRMIIVSDAGKDPDDPDTSQLPNIERVIYFAGPTAAPALPADGSVQFQPDDNHAARIAPIYPGRYAVIGPGKSSDTGKSITYLGFDNGENPGNVGTSPNTTRRIELNPDSDPDTSGQVAVYNNGTSDDLSSVTIKNPTAVVITMPIDQRLSISEPDGGYTNVSPDGSTPYFDTTGYTPNSWDIPLDINSSQSAAIKAAIMNDGRSDNVKVIHLQRLANPLLPYNNTPTNPNYNPYRTIDSMPVDLAAFNGIDTSTDPKVTNFTNNHQFYARQRGQKNSPAGTMNLWGQEPFNDSPTGNVNLSFPPDLTTTTFNLKDWPLHHSMGLLNDPFDVPNTTAGYEGDPQQPFSWLTWNNRPYVSPLELMQVSWLRSSQLLDKYDMVQGAVDPYTNPDQPFPHLMNLFVSRSGTEDEELHRVFEYLRVPSPFVGTETQANPSFAAGTAGHTFQPPFNGISTYREPGRINLNTIYDHNVFYALMNGFPGMNTPSFWQKFLGSRQGRNGSTFLVLGCASGMPTEFARPFRSFGGRALTPDIGTMQPPREIDCTLLRADPSDATKPLFGLDRTGPGEEYHDTDRNPYFRYQGLMRLGNLATTRSNVYAVWITVGYFEVTPNPGGPDAVHPDGYQLGRELGMDTGEIERHRAFYIFDRSIPVGFQRGQDLNVEKAILVDRFIE